MSGTAAAPRSTKCGRRALDGWGAWHGCGQQKRAAQECCFNTSQTVILWCSSRPTSSPPIQAVTGDTCCSFFFSPLSSIFLLPFLLCVLFVWKSFPWRGGGGEGSLCPDHLVRLFGRRRAAWPPFASPWQQTCCFRGRALFLFFPRPNKTAGIHNPRPSFVSNWQSNRPYRIITGTISTTGRFTRDVLNRSLLHGLYFFKHHERF